jgi:hypothetical protein
VPGGDRERHRRLDPPTCRVHRHRRDQADLWTLLALRHGRVRLFVGSGGPDCAHRARRRDHAALDGGTGPQGFDLRRSAGSRLRSGDRPLRQRPDDRRRSRRSGRAARNGCGRRARASSMSRCPIRVTHCRHIT